MKKALFLIFSFLVLITGILVLIFHSNTRDSVEAFCYDLFNKNEYIDTKEGMQGVLSTFKKIRLKDLPKDYLVSSKMSHSTYTSLTKNSSFYVIKKRDCYKKILGNNRIKSLISQDKRYANTWYFSDETLYLGIDERVLYKALELQDALSEKQFDRDALKITSGHRTPQRNKAVGGASKSRHIKGEALDMWIGDINKDGVYSKEDKQIVLELCDKKIIGNEGGIGLYPGTQVVHIDVRGRRARWNSF
ncbi:MAG: DUF882 domain-containing protein [Aureispira sp.]|nr:DUF882 domain-containing protein [Aureispira sp.]